MKKQNKKILIIIFVISLLVNIVTLSRCTNSKMSVAETPNIIKPIEYENTSIGKDFGLVIQNVSEDNEEGVITLTAEVTPSDAPNKEVDWIITWANGASRSYQSANNFVEVTPLSDGSNVARVKCLQAFNGDQIVITVRTRVGGFTAECVCSYVGTPTGLKIDVSEDLITNDSVAGVDIVNLASGESYDFDLSLFNSFGSMGDDLVTNYELSLAAGGEFDVQFRTYSGTGVNETDIKAQDLTDFSNNLDSGVKNYLKCEIKNGKLHIDALNTIQKLVNITGSGTGFTRGWYFKSYTGYEPYLKITVKDKTTNLSETINVRVTSTVTGVTLNKTTITF